MRTVLRLGAAAALLLSACFYPAERGKQLEAKVDKLASDNERLQAELKDTQDKLAATVPKIDQKIVEVTKALESLDKTSHRSSADIGVQMQKAVEDVAQLRGQVDQYVFKIGQLEDQLKQLNDQTTQKFTELAGKEAVKEAEAKKKAEEMKRPEDKKEFLALADQKAKDGDLALARQLYAEFMKKWAKDELVGEAHFGLAETYYTEDKCREALPEYGKVITDFGKAKSAPTAYLRSADCFHKLKMNDESKLALEEVVKQFPKSDAAKTAKTKLAELEKAPAKKTAPAPPKGK